MSEENLEKPKAFRILTLPRQRLPHFVSAYANHIEANPTFYDLRLTFCQIAADLEQKPVVEQHAAIAITWEHAVRLRDLLIRIIPQYEQENGAIRTQKEPPEAPGGEQGE